MDQGKIWSYFQNEAPAAHNSARGRLEFIARKVRRITRAQARVLNVGIGNGYFEEIALKLDLDVFSLDPDEESIGRLQNRLALKEKARVGFLESLPFEAEMFDAVVVSEVLEHLSDGVLQESLREIHRVLRTGGLIVGTVPARESLAEQLVVCPHCGEKFHRWGHVQSFSEDDLKNLLYENFRIREIAEKFLDDWASLNWKGKVQSLMKRSLLFLGVKGSNNSLFFLAVKK
jgi:SAM-dependent methyltransferase